MLYEKLRRWDPKKYQGKDGILTGCDAAQQWLLPWWWQHYRKYNEYPVTFIDCGLTDEMKKWCRERGHLLPLPLIPELYVAKREEVDPLLVEKWENLYGNSHWDSRNGWFCKPFFYLQTPYERTIWIDCDCEIKTHLAPYFKLSDKTGLALRKEKDSDLLPVHYNSGVMVYRWGHLALQMLVDQAVDSNSQFCSDDHLLSVILEKEQIPVTVLPESYHRIRKESEEGALIYHYNSANGKKILRAKIIQNQLSEL